MIGLRLTADSRKSRTPGLKSFVAYTLSRKTTTYVSKRSRRITPNPERGKPLWPVNRSSFATAAPTVLLPSQRTAQLGLCHPYSRQLTTRQHTRKRRKQLPSARRRPFVIFNFMSRRIPELRTLRLYLEKIAPMATCRSLLAPDLPGDLKTRQIPTR